MSVHSHSSLVLDLTSPTSILNLGRAARANFVHTHFLHDLGGEVAYALGFFVALIMWGFGLVWLVFALASIYQSRPFPFNMGWWGFTFPLGVFGFSTITLGIEMPSAFFKVFGTVRWIIRGLAVGLTRQSDSERDCHTPVDRRCRRYYKRSMVRAAALRTLSCQPQSKGSAGPSRQREI